MAQVKYAVTVRGRIPPELAEKISQAHVKAIQSTEHAKSEQEQSTSADRRLESQQSTTEIST